MSAGPALDDEGIDRPSAPRRRRPALPVVRPGARGARRGSAAGRAARAAAPPPPTRPRTQELDRAYAGWYRPDAGRFSGPGDALLRRSRGALARRLDRDRAAGAGARRRRRRRRPARRARAATAARRSASSAQSTRPDVVAAELAEVEGRVGRDRLLALARAPARRPAAALGRAARRSRPSGVLVMAMPNADSLQARAFGDRWLALDLPRHLVHVPAQALVARLRRARAARRAREPPARRPGRVRLAARARRLAARRTPTSMTRSAGPRRAARRCHAARARPPTLAAAAVAAARRRCRRRSPRPPLRRGGTHLRRGAPCLSSPPSGKVDRRDAGAATRRGRSSATVAAIPREWVDEVILVDDKSTDETVELARALADPRHLAPPQRRLRRQPEDLLPARRSSATPTSW